MPVIILAVILALVFGLVVRPIARAFLLTGIVSALVVVTFVWAVADGKGDDPAWELALAAAGVAVAFGVCHVGARLRAAKG